MFAEIEPPVEYISLIDGEDNLLYVNQTSASPQPNAKQMKEALLSLRN